MTEIDQLLKTAVHAAKNGEREKAHQLLLQIVEQDEKNEMAWLWLSGVVATKEDRQICLENVLAINPNNQVAQKGLKKLGLAPPAPVVPQTETGKAVWTEPVYDVVLPQANDPHKRQYDDAWSSSADLCAYCAQPVTRSDKRCPKCSRKMVGNEPIFPNRSGYLQTWIVIRGLVHGAVLLFAPLFYFILPNLSAQGLLAYEDMLYLRAYCVAALVNLPVALGLTVALYFRQVWAYWFVIMGLIFMVLGTVAEAILSIPITNTVAIPAWISIPYATLLTIIQVIYIYMIVMAGGDFRREKRWRIAVADHRIKDPLVLDNAGKLFAQRGMWATAVLYWQRAAGRAPGNVAILRRLADGYARLSFPERTLDTLRQAKKKTLDPKTSQTLSNQIALMEQKIKQRQP